jgi:hypothetical protein
MSQVNRGGKRLGAGRKSKWNTETVTQRVPKALVGEIQAFIERRMGEALKAAPEKPPAPEPGPLELWQGDKRCQAMTVKGSRCKSPTAFIHKLALDGRSIEIGICATHQNQVRQGIDPKPHPSVLESVTKSNQ